MRSRFLFEHAANELGSCLDCSCSGGNILTARHCAVGTSAALTACNCTYRAYKLACVNTCGNRILAACRYEIELIAVDNAEYANCGCVLALYIVAERAYGVYLHFVLEEVCIYLDASDLNSTALDSGELGLCELYPPEKKRWYCKVPVFSFRKISGVDSYLSPEMKSTGEAIGYDNTLNRALYKAIQASGSRAVSA